MRYGLAVDDDADLKAILDAMEAHLRGQRNIIVDRRDFYSRAQESGETLDDFLCNIKEIAAFCDFCTSCDVPVAVQSVYGWSGKRGKCSSAW